MSAPPSVQVLGRAFHPMFALYAGVLAGAALVFDLLYLLFGGGLALAALYTVPVTAGLVACLVAAADELHLNRTAAGCAIRLAAMAGLTNALLLGAVGGILRTGPDNWLPAIGTVLLSAATVLSTAGTVLLLQRLARLAQSAPVPVGGVVALR